MKNRRILVAAALLCVLCAGILAGRMSALWGGAVLRCGSQRFSQLKPLLLKQEEKAEVQPGKININQAGEQELQELPGVGPALAARIVAYRVENGPFETVDELRSVKGIGEKTLDSFRDCVAVK